MIDWAAFKRARSYLSAQRFRIVAAELCAAVGAVCFVLMVVILAWLGELLFAPKHTLDLLVVRACEHWYSRPLAWTYDAIPALQSGFICLGVLVGAIVVLAGLRALCQYVQALLVATAVVDATHRVRRAIYHQAYRLGTTEVSGIGAAPAINVFTREADSLRDCLVAWLDSCVRDPVKIVLLLVVAFTSHWALASLFLVLAGMGGYMAVRQIERARARVAAAVRSAAERLALLQESLFLIRLTRGYLMENSSQTRFERNLGQFSSSESRQLRSTAAVTPVIEFVIVLSVTLVVGLASFNLLRDALSPSSTVALYASLVSLYWPARTLLNRYTTIRNGTDAATAISLFLDQRAQFGEVAGASFLTPMSKTLEFINLRVQEPGRPPAIDGVNLTIRAGTKTAIMGMDDRAKRALVYLVPRFLDPTEGQVRIDGQDIRVVTLESIRAQVALVLQSELVFSGTVAENIGCGDPGYGLPHIVDAAKLSHVHNFVQRLPKGYDTIIGDQGESLSIGQQFRIALARAILRDPTIAIIEEPAVHLDDDTKNLLDDTFVRFCPGRTVLFLPHRLSTIRSCDQIVLLHEGKIETIGNHRELTHSSELYRHLQYTEFNVFAAG